MADERKGSAAANDRPPNGMDGPRRGALLRVASVAALFVLALIPWPSDRTALQYGFGVAVCALWLGAAAALFWLPSRLRIARRNVVAASVDGAFAMILAALPGTPAGLVGGACVVTAVSVYELRTTLLQRGLAAGAVCLLAGALRALWGEPLDGLVFALAAAAVVGGAAWRYVLESQVAPRPEARPRRTRPQDAQEMIENLRRAAREAQARAERAESEAELLQLGQRAWSLHELVPVACQRLSDLAGAHAASLWLLTEGETRLELAGGYRVRSEAQGVDASTHLLGKVAKTRAPSSVSRPGEEAQDPARRPTSDAGPQLVVPIAIEGVAVGVVCLHYPSGRDAPGRQDIARAQKAVELIAPSIAGLTVRERLVDDSARLRLLYEISQTFEAGRSAGELVYDILGPVTELLQCHSANVAVLGPHRKRLEVLAGRGKPLRLLPDLQFTRGHGIAAWVAQERRPLVVPDLHRDRRWGPPIEAVRTFACFPLETDGRLLGVLSLAWSEPERCGPEDEELLRTVAGQIALTIRRSQLYGALETLALMDPVLGVNNERFLPIALEREIALASGQQDGRFAVLMVQPADPSRTADMEALAVEARDLAEPGGVVCRRGNEALVAILPGAGNAEATIFLEELRRRSGVQVYAGAGMWPRDGLEASEVLESAEASLARISEGA